MSDMILPEGARDLVELAREVGARNVWHALSDGRLPAYHLDESTGTLREIARSEWMRRVNVVEDGGDVARRHPVEMLERGDLSWIVTPRRHGPGQRVGSDPVLIDETDARELFTPEKAPEKAPEKVGRPQHPAYEWYAGRNFQRGGLSINALQRQMEIELEVEPPAENTIRNWEKGAQKPPE